MWFFDILEYSEYIGIKNIKKQFFTKQYFFYKAKKDWKLENKKRNQGIQNKSGSEEKSKK